MLSLLSLLIAISKPFFNKTVYRAAVCRRFLHRCYTVSFGFEDALKPRGSLSSGEQSGVASCDLANANDFAPVTLRCSTSWFRKIARIRQMEQGGVHDLGALGVWFGCAWLEAAALSGLAASASFGISFFAVSRSQLTAEINAPARNGKK